MDEETAALHHIELGGVSSLKSWSLCMLQKCGLANRIGCKAEISMSKPGGKPPTHWRSSGKVSAPFKHLNKRKQRIHKAYNKVIEPAGQWVKEGNKAILLHTGKHSAEKTLMYQELVKVLERSRPESVINTSALSACWHHVCTGVSSSSPC